MKNKILNFLIAFLLIFSLFPVPQTAAATLQLLVSSDCLTYDTAPITITAGNTYCYQLTYSGGVASDDLRFNLPGNTFWSAKVGGPGPDPDSAIAGVTQTLNWTNRSFVIYQFRVTTNASAVSASNIQFAVDNDADANFDDAFSNTLTVNVTVNPTVNSATYLDNDLDGKLDHLKLIFSKGIQGTTDGTGFTIAQGSCSSARTITNGLLSTTSVANDTLTFTFNECNLSDSGEKPNLIYDAGTGDINDGAGGNLATIGTGDLTETDGAKPVRISSSSISVANNANLVVEYSETVVIPADAATLSCNSSNVAGTVSRISSNGTNNALQFDPASNLTEASCTLTIASNKVVDSNNNYASGENIAVSVTGLDVIGPSGNAITSGSCNNTGICLNSGDSATKVTAITVTLSATDDSATVLSMYLDGDLVDDANTKEWISYATSKTITLTGTDAVKNISVKYKDAAGNESSLYNDSIALDTQAPLTSINIGGGLYASQQNILLTSEANATIYSEQVAGGVACPSTASLSNYTGNGTVGLIGTASPGKKLCYFAVDAAGNREAVKSTTYLVDANFPNIVIDAIADQYLATGESTTITFTTTDDVGLNAANPNYWIEAGGTGVQGSGDPLVSGQAVNGIQEVSASIAVANPALSEGSNLLYLYLIDTVNNTGLTSLTLFKDTTAPGNASISIENGASAVEGTSVDLVLFANDAGSGLAHMYIDGDVVDDANTKQWINYSTSKTVTLSGAAGLKTISVIYRDQAGNSAGAVSDTINYVATCPVNTYFNGTSCVSTSVSCTIANGTGKQTWDGTSWSVCTVVSCNSGYVIDGNTCHIATNACAIANGTGQQTWSAGAWGVCTPVSCNVNYQISGTTCAAITDGGSGGGGGGGAMVDTTSVYKLPQSESDKVVDIFRPVQVSGNLFTRPVILTNYYNQAISEIELGTEVFDLENHVFENAIIAPPTKIRTATAQETLNVPLPLKTLAYNRYYQFGSLKEKFSKPIKLIFPVYSTVAKLEPTSIFVLKWVPTGLSAQSLSFLTAATTETLPVPEGSWQVLGDGSLIDADYNLILETEYSTLYAIVYADGSAPPSTGTAQPGYGLTPFTDIASHWAKDYIAELYLDKVVSGKTASNFDPDALITRAELTKIALNTFEYEVDEVVDSASFKDVPSDAWFAKFVAKAKQSGVLQGYDDGTFRPNQPINRAEALKILVEAAKINPAGFEASFVDTNPEDWYAAYLAFAKVKGVVEGYAVEKDVPEVGTAETTAKVKNLYTFNRYLGDGNTGEDVENLQKVLQQLGYYKGVLNGNFDTATKAALIQYQLAKGLIVSELNFGAGYFGPKTKSVFEEEVIGQVTYKRVTEYYFKPGQFITRAEIAKIALKIRDLAQ